MFFVDCYWVAGVEFVVGQLRSNFVVELRQISFFPLLFFILLFVIVLRVMLIVRLLLMLVKGRVRLVHHIEKMVMELLLDSFPTIDLLFDYILGYMYDSLSV